MGKGHHIQSASAAEVGASPWLSFEAQIPRVAPRFLFKSAFHFLGLYWVFRAIYQPEGLSLINIAITLLLAVSLGCFATLLVFYRRRPPWARVSYLTYYYLFLTSAWFFFVILRGIELSTAQLFTLVANPRVGGVVWLLPLAAFIGAREGAFGSLMSVARVHMVVGAALLIWFFLQTMTAAIDSTMLYDVALALMYGIPLVLLLGVGSRGDRYLAYGALIIYIIGAFLLSRRAPFAVGILFLIVSVCLGYRDSTKRIVRRALVLGFGLVLVGPLAFGLVIGSLPQEWFFDTRSFLWLEMTGALSGWDWIMGRGALGTYYSPYFEHALEMGREGDWMIRQSVEVGYLFIALKAGLIGVALYCFGLALTMWRAIKLVDVRFGMGVLAYFAIQVAEGFVIGKPEFIMQYIAQWILIGVVLSLPVRQRGGAGERYKTRMRPGHYFSPPSSGLRW
ncbi:MAG: hypothetical protein L0H73_01745 [Nitrococcus sp.]|nr:hypothetical protein [Nitrococcus sp.]